MVSILARDIEVPGSSLLPPIVSLLANSYFFSGVKRAVTGLNYPSLGQKKIVRFMLDSLSKIIFDFQKP